MLYSIAEMDALVLEVGAEDSVAQEELSKSQSPCPPHLLVSRKLLDSILQSLLLLELALPASTRSEGILATFPLDLLLIGRVGCGRLLSELVLPVGCGLCRHLGVHDAFTKESWNVLARGRGRSDVAAGLSGCLQIDQVVRAHSAQAPCRAATLTGVVGG